MSRLALVPLRVRLVAAMLVLVLLGLLVAGLASTTALRGYLVDRVDAQLREVAAPVGQDLERDGRRPLPRVERRRQQLGPSLYVLSTDPAGGVLTESPPDLASAPRLPVLDEQESRERDDSPFTVPAEQGDGQWRVLVVALPGGRGLAVAAGLDDVDRTVRRLLLTQALGGVVVLALLAGVAYTVVRASLRPLRDVEQTAASIAGGDLSRRVPRQDERTEVGRLATAFNMMLQRIEGAFRAQQRSEVSARASEQRLRRFVADASHELRTPLTSIRGFAELYRQGAVPPGPDLDRVIGRVEDEAQRMGQLVEEMLLLARLDQQRPLETVPVDLLQLASDAVHDAQALEPGRPLVLQVTGGDRPPVVPGDEPRLRQVLVNLLGNALAHTPEGTRVDVRLRVAEGRVVLEVADQGPGLTPEQAEHVFERFYRVDTARTRTSGGSGLGLSIVAAIAEAHGGRAGVRPTPGGGATFLVELPVAD